MKRLIELCLIVALCAAAAFAQAVEGYGALTGRVREGAGDGLPDATVVIYNDTLGIKRTMTTSDDGVFTAPALTPGAGYSIKVTRQGFTDWEMKDFEVPLGQTLNVRIEMEGGSAARHVQTTPPLEPMDVTKTAVATTITRQQIDSLPASGRLLDQLVLLAPGVTENSASGILAFRGEPFTNVFLTDGIDTTNTYYYRKAGIAPQLSQEATGEMQVLSSAAPAEFGLGMGGIANAITRSGTNRYHGSGYDYFNEGTLNAPDRYAPGFNPGGFQHQAGFNAGGPMLQSKLFWFLNGEVVDGRSAGLNLITNPLIGTPAGTLVQASNCGLPATPTQCDVAINLIDGQMNRVVQRSTLSGSGVAKADYRLNDANSFTVEANALHRHSPDGTETETVSNNGNLLGYNGTYTEETRFARAGWTTAPAGNAVNELRAGWYRDRYSDYEDNSLLPTAVAIFVAGTPVGGNPAYPLALSEKRYEVVDNLTVASGSHSIKFGASYSKTEDWTDQVYNRYSTYNYPSLTTFAEDYSGNTLQRRNYNSFSQGFGNPVIDLKTPTISAYAQDTWRPLPKLTVTYGVRWEKSMLTKPTFSNSTYYETGSISSPNTDFSPRVGAAYLLDSHTVLRMGFGSYFEPFVGQLLDQLFTGNGIYQANISLTPLSPGALVFPKVYTAPTSFLSGVQNIEYAASKFRNPYSEQFTAAIERNLAKDTSLTVSYIDTRGAKLWTLSDLNLNAPTITKTYTIEDASGAAVSTFTTPIFTAKSDPAKAHVYLVNNEGASSYHALAVQLRERMTRGLSLQASYTWSHSIDDVSGNVAPGLGFLPQTFTPGDYRADQGNSSFDQRQRGVVNWTWQPVVTSGNSPVDRFLLNGWQISTITSLASGLPQTPVVVVNGQQFSGVNMEYPDSLNGSGGWSRVPFQQVNSLRTGPEYDVDARVTRMLPFTERIKGMLMFEAFNALNMQYDTSVNTIAYTATSGVLRPVAGVGSGNAAGGYPYGANARRAQVAFRIVF